MSRFAKDAFLTTAADVVSLAVGIGTSIIIARALGPEGKGITYLAALVPGLIVAIVNLGVGPATMAVVAKGRYHVQEIAGNNVLLAGSIGSFGLLSGFAVIALFYDNVLAGVGTNYLLIALSLIPMQVLASYLHGVLLGSREYKKYSTQIIAHGITLLALVLVLVWALDLGVLGAITATLAANLLTCLLLLHWTRKIADGMSFRPNPAYLKHVSLYGAQIHIGGVLGFLNQRLDMFIISLVLNPAAVGIYSISVGLAERLFLISQAAGTVLMQRVAAENNEQTRKEFTPLIVRTSLLMTSVGSLFMFLLSHWLVLILYSADFSASVKPLQILLPGIVAMSACRLLANDIAAREKPLLNALAIGVALLVNIILNIMWIPRYGIEGAAWASVASYCTALVIVLFIYCHLTRNPWFKVVLPQRSDWKQYRRVGSSLYRSIVAKRGL